MISFPYIISRAVVQGIPLLLGATGETITEKSGNLNLGIPGIMYAGSACGVIGTFLYETQYGATHEMNPFLTVMIPLLFCMIGSLLISLIYCFLTTTLRANQNVTGLAITIFGMGFSTFIIGYLAKIAGGDDATSLTITKTYEQYSASLVDKTDMNWFEEMFLSYGFMVYVAIAIAIIAQLILNYTRVGLHLRAVGESPATADATGVNVTAYKYGATCIGGILAGLGGLYYMLDYSEGAIETAGLGDRGWLAVALVIFTLWKPAIGILGAILFGLLYNSYQIIPAFGAGQISDAVKELYKMLPYVVTILVLIISSIRNKRENQPPASLGLSYFREER